MSRNTTVAVVVVLVLIVGGWYLLRPKPASYVAPPASVTPSSEESSSAATVQSANNLVMVTSNGFSPKEITIKAGESVTWENQDSVDHTVNSAVHPTHLVYPPLNLGVIKPGEQKSLAFPAAGTYKYHDHLNPSLTGSITVQ